MDSRSNWGGALSTKRSSKEDKDGWMYGIDWKMTKSTHNGRRGSAGWARAGGSPRQATSFTSRKLGTVAKPYLTPWNLPGVW